MLTRFAVTLFWVEAEEVWVEAAAPVRIKTTTKARMVASWYLALSRVLSDWKLLIKATKSERIVYWFCWPMPQSLDHRVGRWEPEAR